MRYCLTMIYDVRRSFKDWSEPVAFFFSESTAKEYAELCIRFAKECGSKLNYRVVSRAMSDCVFTDIDPK